MKRLLILTLFIFNTLASFSQINLILDYASFYLPQEGPYLEVYVSVNGNSLQYKYIDSLHQQASIELTYLVEAGDSVVSYDKFQMNSPQYVQGDLVLDMRDLKRIPVPNGDYLFTLIAKDLNSGQRVESSLDLREIHYSDSKLQFSGIQLANKIVASNVESPFVKNGFEIDPNFPHYFGKNQMSLFFYTELYNSHTQLKGEEFLLAYSIVDKESDQVVANLSGFKRLQAQEVIPIIQSIQLNDLPSGKYSLLLQIKNRENKVVAEKRSDFYQSNPDLVNYSAINPDNSFVDSLTDKGVLAEHIRSLSPISSAAEREFAKNQLRFAELKFMQQYFLNFWKTRNPEDPHNAWLAYKKEVEKVDELFRYGKTPGYKTERGRVYLQYGPPSAMQNVPYEPNTYPYSIWLYNKVDGLSNRKFLFYSPSMEILGYEVLHSNMPGEAKYPNWELELMKKSNAGIRPTQETPENTMVNRRARDLWENPR
ncbi:MAG: GWxTD domain-containing protein [Vicingaceae bacterium]